VQRAEALHHLAQVGAAAVEALACARDQELEVVAGVGVEDCEELVGVHVGQRVRDADPAALGQRLALAGIDLQEHVLRPGLGAQQRAGALAQQVAVLPLELELDDRLAVLELDLADVAHAHARHHDRLALPRRDRLGVRQLGLHGVGLVLDQREAKPLVRQDVGADPDAQDHDADDREEVRQVLADRVPHPPASCSASRASRRW
jgi:hypothetical protein